MWELVTSLAKSLASPITNAFQRRGTNRAAHAKDRAAAIEAFLTSHYEFLDKIEGVFSVGGADAPFTVRQGRRAFELGNRMVDELGPKGRAARAAAELLDAKLAELLSEAEGQGVALITRTSAYSVGVTVAPLLAQLDQAKKANRAAATRLRHLQL